jgi:TonB family protein
MTWAHYLLQVNIYLVIFYAFYKLLLDKETYFILNRIYLLSAAALSLAIPFIQPEWLSRHTATQQANIGIDQLNLLITQVTLAPAQDVFNWGQLIASLYIAGMLFFSFRLIWQLSLVKRLIKAKPSGSAFSFFRKKVIDQQLPGLETIHRHEEVHIRQFHTLDIMFFEILGIIAWCNPISYAFKVSIRNIHEYLADEVAAQIQGDKESYAMLLLSKAFGIDQNALTNNFFNQSLLKKRILMLSKERSRKTAILKYGLFLPLFAITLLFSSATISSNEKLMAVAEEIKVPEMLTIELEPQFSHETTTLNQQPPTVEKTLRGTTNNLTQDTILPSFKGGMEEFYKYLAKECKYPKADQDKNISGKVLLSFMVEPTGKLTEIRVVKGVSPTIDAEAIRLMEKSPDWLPGSVGNTPVRTQFNMPISFTLSDDKKDKTKNKKVEELEIIRVGQSDQQSEAAAKTIKIEPAGQANASDAKSLVFKLDGNQDRLKKMEANPPLYMLDGVRIDGLDMKKIKTDDILSINVFKDASATSLYGDDAKNGVIIITTKNNKNAKPANKATSIKGSGTVNN